MLFAYIFCLSISTCQLERVFIYIFWRVSLLTKLFVDILIVPFFSLGVNVKRSASAAENAALIFCHLTLAFWNIVVAMKREVTQGLYSWSTVVHVPPCRDAWYRGGAAPGRQASQPQQLGRQQPAGSPAHIARHTLRIYTNIAIPLQESLSWFADAVSWYCRRNGISYYIYLIKITTWT
jgi:hypothetical protein